MAQSIQRYRFAVATPFTPPRTNLQASAYMKRNLFHQWRLADSHCSTSADYEPLQFGLNLSTFVECLRILGGGSGALDKPATLQVRSTLPGGVRAPDPHPTRVPKVETQPQPSPRKH